MPQFILRDIYRQAIDSGSIECYSLRLLGPPRVRGFVAHCHFDGANGTLEAKLEAGAHHDASRESYH